MITEEKSIKDKSFNEILLTYSDEHKSDMAAALIRAFKAGEPSAIKFVSQVMQDSQFREETAFPINEDRFKQIITMVADAIREGSL